MSIMAAASAPAFRCALDRLESYHSLSNQKSPTVLRSGFLVSAQTDKYWFTRAGFVYLVAGLRMSIFLEVFLTTECAEEWRF